MQAGVMDAMAPVVSASEGVARESLSRSSPARVALGRVRRSEWVMLAFLAYAPTLAVAIATPAVRSKIMLWDLPVLAAYALLIVADSARPRLGTSVARDWLPLAVVLLAYREMGWFALPHPEAALETRWVVWDRALLGGGARAMIEALGPTIPSILEVSYSLVYTLAPFAVAVLYLRRQRAAVDRFLFVFVLSVLLCYAQFPLWPSEPPRVVFAGQDLPLYDTIFRRFNLWMLGAYGIHTSVFPSAHVAGAFGAAFGMRLALPDVKWVNRLLFTMAVLIAIATVYGRYHYTADASAGFVVATMVFVCLRRFEGSYSASISTSRPAKP